MAGVTTEELRRLRQLSPSTADAAIAQAKRQGGVAPQVQFWGFDPARRQVLVDPAIAPAGVMTALGRLQQPPAPEGAEGASAAPGSVQARLELREGGKVEVEPESFYEMLYMDDAADLVKEYGPKIIDDIRDSLPELPDATSFGLIEGVRQVRSALRLDKLPSWMTMSIPEMGGALDVALSKQLGRDPGPLGRAYQGQRPDIQTFTGAMVQDTAQMLPGVAVTAPFGGWAAQSVNRVRKMPLVSQLLGTTVTFSGAEALSFDPFDTENYGTIAEDLTMAGDLLSIYESGDRSNPRWREAEAGMEQPIIRLFGEARNMLPAPAQEALAYLVRNPEDGEAMRRFKMAAGGLVDTATEAMFLGVVESGKAIKQFGRAAGPEALDAMIRLGDAARERNAARRADGSVTLNSGADPQQAFDFMAENLGEMAKAARAAEDQVVVEPYYSALNRAVGEFRQGKATPDQWKGMIGKLQQQGVKPDEIDFSGVSQWLDQQEGPVTKADLLAYLNAENNIRITQTEIQETGQGNMDRLREEYGYMELEAQDPSDEWLEREAEYYIDDVLMEDPNIVSDFEAGKADGDIDENADFREWVDENYRDQAEQMARDSYFSDNDFVQQSGYMRVGNIEYEASGSQDGGFSIRATDTETGRSWDVDTEYGSQDPNYLTDDVFADYAENGSGDPGFGQLANSDEVLGGAAYGPGGDYGDYNEGGLTLPGAEAYREIAFSLPDLPGQPFTQAHFGPDNTFAHARVSDRQARDGMRFMLVEEVQSDLHRRGAKNGYRDPAMSDLALDKEGEASDARWRLAGEPLVRSVNDALQPLIDNILPDDLEGLEAVTAAGNAIMDDLSRAIDPFTLGGAFLRQDAGFAEILMDPDFKLDDWRPRMQDEAKGLITNALRSKHREAERAAGRAARMVDSAEAAVNEQQARYDTALDIQLDENSRRQTNPKATAKEHMDRLEAELDDARVTQLAADVRLNTYLDFLRKVDDGDPTVAELIDGVLEVAVPAAQTQIARNRNQAAVPDAPFKTQWPELVMKRLIQAATESRHSDYRPYEALVLAPAQVHKDRYNLATKIDGIDYIVRDDGKVRILGYDADNSSRLDETVEMDKLEDAVGSDLAARIRASQDDHAVEPPDQIPEQAELDALRARMEQARSVSLVADAKAASGANVNDVPQARRLIRQLKQGLVDGSLKDKDWAHERIESAEAFVAHVARHSDPLSEAEHRRFIVLMDAQDAITRQRNEWERQDSRRIGINETGAEVRSLGNASLELGGKWTEGLYTNKIPRFLQQYIKKQKLDTKLKLMTGEELGIPADKYQDTKFMVMPITPEVKRRIKARGQPLWSVGGGVGLAAVATGQAPDEEPREPQDQERSALLGLLRPALVPEGSAL